MRFDIKLASAPLFYTAALGPGCVKTFLDAETVENWPQNRAPMPNLSLAHRHSPADFA